jgi:hypothetical protein
MNWLIEALSRHIVAAWREQVNFEYEAMVSKTSHLELSEATTFISPLGVD